MNTKISERKLNALAEYRINNIDNVYNMAAIGLYNKVLGLIKGISEKGISEIKLGQFIKDNNLDPRKVNKKLISEIASENSIKITVRKNYPDVRAPNRKQRNYDRFKVLNDAQFARENGITRERARQLRNIHAPETNTRKNTRDYWDAKSFEKSKEIDEWILTYIQNKPVDILIFEFRKFHNLNEGVILGGLINRSRFKKIAKENNINISFGNFRHKNTEYGMVGNVYAVNVIVK